jgi:ribonuclease HI
MNPKPGDLLFTQINLQHCKVASDLLSERISGQRQGLALVQEPWVRRERVQGLATGGKTVIQGCTQGKPRTCIVTTPNTDITLIPEISNADLTAGLLRVKIGGGKRSMVVASAYLPSDAPTLPPTRELEALVLWCRARNLPMIIGSDANARHVIWGSRLTNRRGEALATFLAGTDLELLNRGNAPTFATPSGRRSVIDITVASRSIVDHLKGWKVLKEESLSDHKYITCSLRDSEAEVVRRRNPRSTNWNKFQRLLGEAIGGRLSLVRTVDDIELEVGVLSSAILAAYEQACPLRTSRRTPKAPWWNQDIAEARNRAQRLFVSALRTGEQDNWDLYRDAKRECKSLIARAKKDSWKAFCDGVTQTPEAGRLQRVLRKDQSGLLGFLRKPDGRFTSSKQETLDHLMDTHFPGSHSTQRWVGQGAYRRAPPLSGTLVAKVFSVEKVRWAISQFEPYKAAGPDGVIPAMLQHGKDVVAPLLSRIFQACAMQRYNPVAWRHAKVIFIPKPGKQTYESAKSFRPISLTSFCLKTMERLLDLYIRIDVMGNDGFHQRQHAYRTGRSTESALRDVAYHADRAILRRQYCLGVFLDIEGAFDNASFGAIERALRGFGVHPCVSGLVGYILRSRTVMCSAGDTEITRQVTRGCPQGGVLSPLLWNLVVDELLRILDEQGIFGQFYADDGTLLVSGGSIRRVASTMQRGLTQVERWCRRNKLAVNPSKTEMVLFTRRRRLDGFVAPSIFGGQLSLSDSVKYLGVVFDRKLSWKAHVENRCNKAQMALFQCRSAIGKTWGLKPSIVYWLYNVVIKPIVLYGAITWWKRAGLTVIRNRLNKLQRLACSMITGCFKTTPTAAMEVMLDQLPLDLAIRGEALLSHKRLVRAGIWVDDFGGGGLAEIASSIPLLAMPEDRCIKEYSFNRKFSVSIEDRGGALNRHRGAADADRRITCFTDGSRMETTGKAGAGYYIREWETRESAPLGSFTSVFQSEVWALKQCALRIVDRGCQNHSVEMFSDSQAALLAVGSHTVVSPLVRGCISALNKVGEENSLTVTWVPGHEGVEGNEIADELARDGSAASFYGPEPAICIPTGSVRSVIRGWLRDCHTRVWHANEGCRQGRLTMLEPSRGFSKLLLGLSRTELRVVTGMLSGHNGLAYHMGKMGMDVDPLCSICGQQYESSIHLICFCDGLDRQRALFLGDTKIEPGEVGNLPIRSLLGFAKATGKWEGWLGVPSGT